MEEERYNNLVVAVTKLEAAVIELADGEVAVRAPKLRKIKSSIKSIQSSFGRLLLKRQIRSFI